jgi:hypothetical protein
MMALRLLVTAWISRLHRPFSVYVQYKDNAGNISLSHNDTINLTSEIVAYTNEIFLPIIGK